MTLLNASRAASRWGAWVCAPVVFCVFGCSGNDAALAAHAGGDAAAEAEAGAGTDSGSADASSETSTIPDAFFEGGTFRALLSETGLFTDTVKGSLAPGVRTYEPQGVLWADGASKRRWVWLPPGTRIDTSDMDYWSYPIGTKLWKEFTVGTTRVETRLIEKMSDGNWNLIAYQWKPDQSDAVAVPDGAQNVSGTDHDIPAQGDCQRCHGGLPDDVLGFTAVQLSHTGAGVTLDSLLAEGRLTNPPAAPLTIPGDAVTQDALRYLHANCGQCHNPRSFVTQQIGYGFWLNVATLTSADKTESYRTGLEDLHAARDLANSIILERMRHRGNGQMPPLATKHVDEVGVAAVEAWLATLIPGYGLDGGTDAGPADAAR